MDSVFFFSLKFVFSSFSHQWIQEPVGGIFLSPCLFCVFEGLFFVWQWCLIALFQ